MPPLELVAFPSSFTEALAFAGTAAVVAAAIGVVAAGAILPLVFTVAEDTAFYSVPPAVAVALMLLLPEVIFAPIDSLRLLLMTPRAVVSVFARRSAL